MKTIIRIEHNCGNGLWRAKKSNDRDFSDDFSFIDDLINKHREFPTV